MIHTTTQDKQRKLGGTKFMWQLIMGLLIPMVLVTYFYQRHFGDDADWGNVIGGVIATAFGIIVGVPISFLIERTRLANVDAGKQLEINNKKAKVSKLLETELEINKDTLKTYVELAKLDKGPQRPLKTSSWQALKATGDLKYIDNPAILTSIADAYWYFEIINNLIQTRMDAILIGGNREFNDGSNPHSMTMHIMKSHYTPANEQINKAIDCLRTEKSPS